MKILYYECFSGISGDMNLGAMIDLGVDWGFLKNELSKLGLDDEFSIEIKQDSRKGINGTKVDVHLLKAHNHEHRNLKDIETIIETSLLDEDVKKTSLSIFREVAKAEAKVHGKDIYGVHFHEVGGIDSIVDIVGAAICYHKLDIDGVWASSVELGDGFVESAHGVIPVPAPATVEILHNCPTKRGAVNKETTTPTGAAILSSLASKFTDRPLFITKKTGYGIGSRDNEIPNVLRVSIAEVGETGEKREKAVLLQCNIDDMTPEMLGVVLEKLMDEGAMDVHFTPILMKKNRPATKLSLLCSDDDEEKFKDIIFEHTTTLGIKTIPLYKTVLETSFEPLETSFGTVIMKNAHKNGTIIRSKPELESCRKISEKRGIPLLDLYLEIGRLKKY